MIFGTVRFSFDLTVFVKKRYFDTRKDNSLKVISVLTFSIKCPNFVRDNKSGKISYKIA